VPALTLVWNLAVAAVEATWVNWTWMSGFALFQSATTFAMSGTQPQ